MSTGAAPALRIRVVEPAVTRTLRLQVLRDGDMTATPPGEGPRVTYLAALTGDDAVVGSVSLAPAPCPRRPDVAPAWQLMGMAVDPGTQGTGVGSAVVSAAVEEVRRHGAVLIWCHARDSAAAFYRRNGFVADGPGYVTRATGLPHHLMWRELSGTPTSS